MTRSTQFALVVLVAVATGALGIWFGTGLGGSGTGEGFAQQLPQSVDPDAPYVVSSFRSDGTPMRWDPCTPIRWQLEETGAPFRARELVEEAMGMISDASGLTFEYVGTTDEVPSRDRRGTTTVDGELAWAPVLLSWSTRAESDVLQDGAVGTASPLAVGLRDAESYTSGQVVFDANQVGALLSGFQGRNASWGGVVLHELGHLVGLGHVEDTGQLMAAYTGFGPAALQAGDLAGLAAVGATGGCLEVPPPSSLP